MLLFTITLLSGCTYLAKREIPPLSAEQRSQCQPKIKSPVRVFIYEDSEDRINSTLLGPGDLRTELEHTLIQGQQFSDYEFVRVLSNYQMRVDPKVEIKNLDARILDLKSFNGKELSIYIRKLSTKKFSPRMLAGILTLAIIPTEDYLKALVGVKLKEGEKSSELIVTEEFTVRTASIPYPDYKNVDLKLLREPLVNAVEFALCEVIKKGLK